MEQQINIDDNALDRPAGRGVGVSGDQVRQFAGENRRIHQVLNRAIVSLMLARDSDAVLVVAVEVFYESGHRLGLRTVVGVLMPIDDRLSAWINTFITHIALRQSGAKPQGKQHKRDDYESVHEYYSLTL